jgi:endonuclease YncB( thermonuclease family)
MQAIEVIRMPGRSSSNLRTFSLQAAAVMAMGAFVIGGHPQAAWSSAQRCPTQQSSCQDSTQSLERRLKGSVTKVSDGDTIHFVVDGTSLDAPSPSFPKGKPFGDLGPSATRLKVRMTGIDTPELHLPVAGGMASQGYWAEEAWHRLEELLPLGSRAELVDYGKDHYGRTLGRVYISAVDVHAIMLEEGLAALYLICTGTGCTESFYKENKVETYVKSCEAAVKGQLGIFSPVSGLDELPFEFRLRKQNRVADKWVGNLKTKQLFEPSAYNQVPICDRIFFPVREEAEKLGYIVSGS